MTMEMEKVELELSKMTLSATEAEEGSSGPGPIKKSRQNLYYLPPMKTKKTTLTTTEVAAESEACSDTGAAAPAEGDGEIGDAELEATLSDYFRPLHEEYVKKLGKEKGLGTDVSSPDFKICPKLVGDICRFIWSPDVFKGSNGFIKRVYKELGYFFKASGTQSDMDDLIKYVPSRLIAAKFSQIVLAMAMADPGLVSDEFDALEKLWEKYQLLATCGIEKGVEEAYHFLYQTLKTLYAVLTGVALPVAKSNALTYEGLSKEAKCLIDGYSVLYSKNFKLKPTLRTERLQKVKDADCANVEWPLFLSEILRLNRRERDTNWKRPQQTFEEQQLVKLTLQLDPKNPYVRLNLIDCVIDAIREQNGRFHLGEGEEEIIRLRDMEDAMRFLRKECRSILEDFPNNLQLNSVISDYFTRYVSVLYFDPAYAGALLQKAYELDKKDARTAHRFGIYYRMSMKNFPESLKWLEKSVELDPYFFNANMDYYKLLLRDTEKYNDTAKRMTEKVNSPASEAWKPSEKAEFEFNRGLAHFACGIKEETLKIWRDSMHYNEQLFLLTNMDSDSTIFGWNDQYISAEMVRGWIQEELNLAKSEPGFDDGKRKDLERMFKLMLGIVAPAPPPPVAGPYSREFTIKYGLKPGIIQRCFEYNSSY